MKILYCSDIKTKRAFIGEKMTALSNQNRKCLLLVPEQQVLEAEGFVCSLEAVRGVEVASFRRAANSIFRKFGGLRYNYIGSGAKEIVMWRTLLSLSPALREYKNLSLDDMSVIRLLLSTVEELKIYSVTPLMLEAASDTLAEGRLKDKLSDISLIYAAYSQTLNKSYDDASDDIERAAAILENESFFSEYDVIVDSFDGFTPQELLLLRKIFEQSRSTLITLAYKKSDKRELFTKLRETDRQIRRLASSLSLSVEEESLTAKEKLKNSEIEFFRDNIFSKNKENKLSCGNDEFYSAQVKEGIWAVRCPWVYDEARFISSDISRRVREGARYRDFAVIARSIDKYTGIIDAALDSCRIPYFVSERRDATQEAEVRMIVSALDIHTYNWRLEDVISYMRTGLSGLTQDECDALEEYASVWRISGSRWYDEYGWQMNPHGFTADFDERAEEKLVLLNSLREKLVLPLTGFFSAFEKNPSVKNISRALVYFMKGLGLSERLSAASELDRGLFGEKESVSRQLVYNTLIDSIDQLVAVAGDIPISSKEYSKLFSAVISKADIGKLPSRSDEVMLGSADLIRKSDAKYVYVIGLSEGEFPLSSVNIGCFDREEKETLSELGIETSPDGEKKFSEELLYFYKAVTSAERLVVLTYSYRDINSKEQYQSSALSEAMELFSRKATDYSQLPKEMLLYSVSDILEYSVKKDIELCGINSAMTAKYAATTALEAFGDEVSAETASKLYGRKLLLTQSRMDKFVTCPFAYHCTYSLGLDTGAVGSFESVDIGNYIHKILESFFALTSDKLKEISDKEARELLDNIINDYVAHIRRGNTSKRFDALIIRLKRVTRLLVSNLLSEFRNSDFVPTFFELSIGDGAKNNSLPSTEIKLDDNSSVVIAGKIDRVDTFRQGKNTYIRIVDYKTGSKTFSMKDIALGLNMQMLIYLFALSGKGAAALKSRISCEGDIIPAGVLYFSLTTKSCESAKKPESLEAGERMMTQKISRSGILLDDVEILTAMDNSLSGKFVPVTLSKDGSVKAGASTELASLEELGLLAARVEDTVKKIARELKAGKAFAEPLVRPQSNPCDYCKMKPICRITAAYKNKLYENQKEKSKGD